MYPKSGAFNYCMSLFTELKAPLSMSTSECTVHYNHYPSVNINVYQEIQRHAQTRRKTDRQHTINS
jgi:hypothetical protein